jgi:hypothetical protein
MPLSIRPFRRFPMQCAVTYNADPRLKLPLAAATHFERDVLGQGVRFAIKLFPLRRCRGGDRSATVNIFYRIKRNGRQRWSRAISAGPSMG